MEKTELEYRLLSESIGLPINVISNEYQEFKGNSHHRIVFQIEEEESDTFAIGILFTLSLMSFTFSAPRGYSENEFIPDEEWNLEYFVQGLTFEGGVLKHSTDYVSGRMMKTDIVYETGGEVTLETRNRGKGADRWLTHLQGKKHIQPVAK
ncbi:MAG: hypothetical protein ABIL58_24785 [Pseudomonadota bacterium]